MEVRVERKRNSFFKKVKKLHIVWKALAVLVVIGVLTGGMVLWFGRKPSLAAEYDLKKDPATGKYIFHVTEVVPQKGQAILGFFIPGQEDKIIPLKDIENFVGSGTTYQEYEYKNFFYYWTKNWDGSFNAKSPSTNVEPFTVKKTGELENNEIFKLYMLGIGQVNTQLSPYDNLVNNRDVLKKFNDEFEISYEIVTPDQLTSEIIDKTQYLHIGSGWQIRGIDALYKKTGHSDLAAQSEQKFTTDISSFSLSDKIYQRAISENGRLSVSINVYPFWNNNHTEQYKSSNLFKLYWMLNYFDDTEMFKEYFEGGDLSKGNSYIDQKTGDIINGSNRFSAWTEHNMNTLTNAHAYSKASFGAARPGNYIPKKHDNILLYNSQGGIGGAGFFEVQENVYSTSGTNGDINTILNFNKFKPEEGGDTQDITVKVLEIEPSTEYRFQENMADREILANWLGTSAEKLDVISVTPNELNGLTADLVSDFDMIYIGNQTGRFGENTTYRKTATAGREYAGLPYQHIGSRADTVLTNPLINGLLEKDKTNAADFAALTGTEFQADNGFLRNVGLELSFAQTMENLGHGRFSGNDITKSMKEQLKEFIDSAQPVVVADSVYAFGEILAEELKKNSSAQDKTLDANLYFLLAETKFQGGSDEADSVKKEGDLKTGDLKGYLKIDDKPGIEIVDSQKTESDEFFILEYGSESDSEAGLRNSLSSLKPSRELTFSYTVQRNRSSSDYKMKVLIDRNGDGIFDETPPDSNDGAASSIRELVGNFKIEQGKEEGTFSVPLQGGQSICQFRVIVEEDTKGGLRKSWTGYVKPEGTREINILQIMSDGATDSFDKKLSENTDFLSLLDEAKAIAPEYEFDFEKRFKAVTASEFSSEYTRKNSLDAYNLIIVGFDYGKHMTDITGEALKVLEDYITVQKKPIIFAKNTISYVNTEYYKTPVVKDYQWVKVTEGAKTSLAGEGELVDSPTLRRREISKKEYELYREANKEIKEEDKEERIYLENVKKEIPKYEAVFGPVLKEKLKEIPEEGKRTVYMGYWWGIAELQRPMLLFQNESHTKSGYLGPNEIQSILEGNGYDAVYTGRRFTGDYDLTVGWITAEDLKKLDENSTIVEKIKTYRKSEIFGQTVYFWKDRYSYQLRDILKYQGFWPTGDLDTKDVDEDENNTIDIDGVTYYLHHEKYLAKKSEGGMRDYYYYWEQLVPSAPQLISVAGTPDALYPELSEWGYQMSKGLRTILGMDRFSITNGKDALKGRDSGTAWIDKEAPEELQGFTNGALLEYAVTVDDKGKPVEQVLPYSNGNIAFGMDNPPRTDAVRVLNEGVVSRYPFEIQSDDEEKITIEEQQSSYYQLDLERRAEKEKTDNVAVWFTLAGTNSNNQELIKRSSYFEDTDGDAGNNYYLYSKGNIYYTGYNLPDKDVEQENLTAAQEQEMKLFINTIYAALTTTSVAEKDYYDTVLNEEGTLSLISRAAQLEKPNRYTCYYEEGEEKIKLRFRIQKVGISSPDASAGTIPLLIGIKGETDDTGLPSVVVPDTTENLYQIVGLPEGTSLTSFPVINVTAEPDIMGSLGGGVSDIWFELEVLVADDTENHILVIGADESPGSNKVMPGSIYAEIQFVKRDLFDLD